MALKARVLHAQATPVNPRLPLMQREHALASDYFLFRLVFIEKINKIIF